MRKILLTAFSLVISFVTFAQVVISEIMYNPPESGTDSLEFVELYNAGTTTVNLNSHSLFWGNAKRYTFTADSNLAAGQLFVLAVANANAVRRQYNLTFTPTVATTISGLSNSGTAVKLLGAADVTLDSVSYLNSWYSTTNGSGSSLILCNPGSDNTLAANWAASAASTGNTINSALLKASPGILESCSGGLPVTWLKLVAENSQNNETILHWQVEEYDAKKYVVEQSKDATNFEQVATIAANGNGKHTYSYTIKNYSRDLKYYRLKQLDLNGSFSYSKIVYAQPKHKTDFQVIANPVKDVLLISLNEVSIKETFYILNTEGALLQTIKPNQTLLKINMSNYSVGTYFVRSSNGGSIPFVKL